MYLHLLLVGGKVDEKIIPKNRRMRINAIDGNSYQMLSHHLRRRSQVRRMSIYMQLGDSGVVTPTKKCTLE